MKTAVIKEMSEKSLAGKAAFPEVVKTLIEGGLFFLYRLPYRKESSLQWPQR